eukprot:TRINITY_DN7014_c0_g2_i1.p1 TRINITY_DN7014_c0_g2~~TRINITY_DN7014_c0_g2_i1.p1  ORF type:complete len:302 (-),score=53.24 TRINITY_DN7014_c0_g2_i1:34-939(-)
MCIRDSPDYEEIVGDVRLLRFLRATKYDVNESAEMFRRMIVWRREEGIDQIRNDIVKRNLEQRDLPGYDGFVEFYPVRFFFGQDFEGNPICRDQLGDFAPKSSKLGEEEVMRFWIYHLEFRMLLLDRLSREQGKLVLVYEIKDLKGVSMGSLWACKPLLSRLAKINTSYYVETTRRVAVFNLPGIFSMLYTAAKPFIPERSLAKIKIIDDESRIEEDMSHDMTMEAFNAEAPLFDARPKLPVVLAEGAFGTPPSTPPHVELHRCEVDPQDLRDALLDLGIIDSNLVLSASEGEETLRPGVV